MNWSKQRQLSVTELDSVSSFIEELNDLRTNFGVTLDSHTEMILTAGDGRTFGYVVFDRDADAYVYQRETTG